MKKFDYDVFATRNLGFIDSHEQDRLRKSKVFIPGVGGMGGTLLVLLARMGIEHFIIADMDTFELSNLNRQIFANIDTIDQSKVQTAKNEVLKINPNISIETYEDNWVEDLDHILGEVDLIVNGCDDVKATITLLRKAREHNKTVIDAFASVLPNVYVIRPGDPRPEEIFNYPSNKLALDQINKDIEAKCLALEIEHVLVHSSTAKYVILKYAAEMITGKRKRISFAPMVWGTSVLMSFEAVKILLGKKSKVTVKGVFLNPWDMTCEHPLPFLIAKIKKIFVRRFLNKQREQK